MEHGYQSAGACSLPEQPGLIARPGLSGKDCGPSTDAGWRCSAATVEHWHLALLVEVAGLEVAGLEVAEQEVAMLRRVTGLEADAGTVDQLGPLGH